MLHAVREFAMLTQIAMLTPTLQATLVLMEVSLLMPLW